MRASAGPGSMGQVVAGLSGDRHGPRPVGIPVLAMAAPEPHHRSALPFDEAVIDHQLGTTDVFVVLPLDRVPDRYHERFERDETAAAEGA